MTQRDIVCADLGQVRGVAICRRAQGRSGSIARPPAASDAFDKTDLGAGRGDVWPGLLVTMIACALLAAIGFRFVDGGACRPSGAYQAASITGLPIDTVARRIVAAESTGDPNAKNDRSSATGAGQFLDATWLDLIRAAHPDFAGRSAEDILELRHDPDLSREIVSRFAQRNAAILASHCLPVTSGTIYLSHFAGGAGAVAVLTAPESADAATTVAKADATGRITRDMIVKANPFLERFTVADLRRWADRKMRRVADRFSQAE